MMERDSAAEYFFSLADEAASSILRDPLREIVPVSRWKILDQEEVELDDRLKQALSGTQEEPEKASKPQRPSSLSFLAVSEMLSDCHECEAWFNRTENITAGQGASKPLFVFVFDRVLPDGTYMTDQEDVFFSKWLAALHLDRAKECYLTSVIKCPGSGDFIYRGCEDILVRQLESLKPSVVVMLGSAGCFISTGDGDILAARGRVLDYHGFRTVCSFSPSQVLADYNALRRPVWEDLKLAASAAGIAGRTS